MRPVNNRISEYDFAKSVFTFSSMNDQAKKKFLKRIRRKYGKGLSDCPDSTVGSYLSLSLFSLPPSLSLLSLPPLSLPRSTLHTQDGITFSDLRAFTQLLESISDIEMALGMYMAAGASITAGTLFYHL